MGLNSPIAVDFFTHVGTPFSVLQYSFSPQTVLSQLAPAYKTDKVFILNSPRVFNSCLIDVIILKKKKTTIQTMDIISLKINK